MVALPRSPDASRSAAVAVGIANLFPLVGVLALGWDATALILLYWFELGVVTLFALLRGVFAGRPSELETDALVLGALVDKRASVSVPQTGVRIHLSSVLVLSIVAPFLALLWVFTGPVLLALTGTEGPSPETVGTVLLAAFGIAIAEALTTAADYFYRGGYRDESAQTAVRGLFFRMVTVLLVGLLIVPVLAAAVADDTDVSIGEVADPATFGPIVLALAVLIKFGADLAGLYHDRLVAFDESTSLTIGWAHESPPDEPVRDRTPDPDTRCRPTTTGRLFGWPLAEAIRPGGWLLAALLLGVAAFVAVAGYRVSALAIGLFAVVAPLAVLVFDSVLRYGAVEYRIASEGDRAVVAYDRLFGLALWRIEPWDETDLRVERDRIDRRVGTRSVVIELPDRTVRIPLVADPAPILAAFDRRADRPDRDGSDRRPDRDHEPTS